MKIHAIGRVFMRSNRIEELARENKVVIINDSSTGKLGNLRELKTRRICIHTFGSYMGDGYLHRLGKVEKDFYIALEGADALVLIDRNLTVLDSHTTRMAAPYVEMHAGSSGSLTCGG